MVDFQTKKGFTLIELLVAMAIFSIIVVAIGGIFSSILKAQRLVIGTQNAQEPARYLFESMAKEIRVSTVTSETTTDLEGDSSIEITNPDGEEVIYTFSGGTLTKNGNIVSPGNVTVDGRFFTVGMDPSLQAKTTVVMRVQSMASQAQYQVTLNLQSTISARGY